MKRLFPVGLVAATSLVFLGLVLKLWHGQLGVPLYAYREDGLFISMIVKSIVDHGWYLINPSVGAPFALHTHDYPFGVDNLHFFLMKALALVTGDYAAVINIYFVATFVLTAVTGYLVMRRLSITPTIAGVVAILYSFLPYHFLRNQMHLGLASYYMVPISILLVHQIWDMKAPFMCDGKLTLDRRSLWTALGCLAIGIGGIYYAFFTCFMAVVAAVSSWVQNRTVKALLPGALIIGLIGTAVIANTAPSLVYRAQQGPNQEVAHRNPIESEIYGMKVTQLLLPMSDHRLPVMRQIASQYNNFPLPNEGSEMLGILGSIGFLSLLFLRISMRPANEETRNRLSVLNLAAVLLATIGAFGALFATYVSPSIRAYNRISIFIAYIALLELAFLLEWLRQRYFMGPRRQKAWVVPMVGLLGFGLVDQTVPGFMPNYEAIQRQFHHDRAFFRQVQSLLPAGSMVYQLPYVPFPENPPVNKMSDYQHFRAYMHTDKLRWSYGDMKGRHNNWHRHLNERAPDVLLPTLAAAGFNGLYIDRDGYADGAVKLEGELRALLKTEPLISPDQKLVFFDLRPYMAGFMLHHMREVTAYRGALAAMDERSPLSIRQTGHKQQFAQLYGAANAYLAAGGDLKKLAPATLMAKALLPVYYLGHSEGSGDWNWTATAGWVGSWSEKHFAVGQRGDLESLKPIIETYKDRATELYFPFPDRLGSHPPANREGQLLMVFPAK